MDENVEPVEVPRRKRGRPRKERPAGTAQDARPPVRHDSNRPHLVIADLDAFLDATIGEVGPWRETPTGMVRG